jgi:hypothetical protein
MLNGYVSTSYTENFFVASTSHTKLRKKGAPSSVGLTSLHKDWIFSLNGTIDLVFVDWIDEYDPPSPRRVSSQASNGTVATASPPPSQLKAWTGNPPIKTSPMKRKRSESPAPTQPPSVHSGSWVAGPPTTFSSTPSRPLYSSSPRPSKRAKANPTSEDELWQGDELSEESLASISQVPVPEKKAATSASGSKTNHARPLNIEVTPKRNPEVAHGLATPVSNTKPPGPRFSVQKTYDATDKTPKRTARDLGKGPILDEDPVRQPLIRSSDLVLNYNLILTYRLGESICHE